MFVKKNLIGREFGCLVVVAEAGRNKRRVMWKCQCKCGNETRVSGSKLLNNRVKSCGCLKEGRKLENGEACKNNVYYQYTSGAKRRNLVWEIDKEYFFELTQQNCHYCHSSPTNLHSRPFCYLGEYRYNGIDRIDSNVGYTKSNCVPCCCFCNRAKGTRSYEEFMQWIKHIQQAVIS